MTADDGLLDDLRRRWPPLPAPDREGYRSIDLRPTRPIAALPLDDAVIVVAEAPDGLVLVPLHASPETLARAVPGDGVAGRLLAAMADAERKPGRTYRRGPFEIRAGVHSDDPVRGSRAAVGERPIGTDQTNESVIVDGADGGSILKWTLRPRTGDQPALRIPEHLDAVGFVGIPARRGVLIWHPPTGGDVLLAEATAYLSGASDGWQWCVEEAVAELDGAPDLTSCSAPAAHHRSWPAAVGELAAGLHAAAARSSTVIPTPLAEADSQALQQIRHRAVDTLARAVVMTAQDWLTEMAPRLGVVLDRLPTDHTTVQPIHGDLHVGQILRADGRLVVIDFDGNPTPGLEPPGRPQPAARDLAQLLCSIGHVGWVADRRGDHHRRAAVPDWIRISRRRLAAAYRAELTRLDARHLLDDRLLEPFMVEQECRELVYAATHLPRWAYAPTGSLRDLGLEHR